MARRSQFTVDAQAVQGNEGARVTFKALKMRQVKAYREENVGDRDMLQAHILGWVGIVDDAGNPLPNPAEDPEALGELYVQEHQALVRVFLQGPDGAEAKNSPTP